MNPKSLFFRVVTLLAFLTVFASAFAQSPCSSNDYVQITILRSGVKTCLAKQTAENWVADGRAIFTKTLTVDSEVQLSAEGATSLESCPTGNVKVVVVSGVQYFCVTKSVAERWIAQQVAVEIDEKEGLAVISAPEIFPERLCTESQVHVALGNTDKIVCTSKARAQKWLSSGFATKIDQNTQLTDNPFTDNPCKSSSQIQATMIRGGVRVCALESTVESWEKQGLAIRTSAINVTPETELVAENTILLEECEENYVKVMLIVDEPAFCITKSQAERWITAKLAFDVDEEAEEITTISAPELFPARLCGEAQARVSILDGTKTICTSKVIAQRWLNEGFATKAD